MSVRPGIGPSDSSYSVIFDDVSIQDMHRQGFRSHSSSYLPPCIQRAHVDAVLGNLSMNVWDAERFVFFLTTIFPSSHELIRFRNQVCSVFILPVDIRLMNSCHIQSMLARTGGRKEGRGDPRTGTFGEIRGRGGGAPEMRRLRLASCTRACFLLVTVLVAYAADVRSSPSQLKVDVGDRHVW